MIRQRHGLVGRLIDVGQDDLVDDCLLYTSCPIDVLLIDEPTADMSPENSMATSAMLASLGKQIITISHSPYDSSVCSNQIVLGGE